MVKLHRDFIHLQHRATRDLRGLIIGRVIDRDTVATGRETRNRLYARDRFSTVLRLHVKGWGILFVHAKHLPAYLRRTP